MTCKKFLTIPEAATLIAQETGGDKFQVAVRISEKIRLEELKTVSPEGYYGRWPAPYYGVVRDASGTFVIGFANDIDECGNWQNFVRLDLEDVLTCLGYHSSIQERILNLHSLTEPTKTLTIAETARNTLSISNGTPPKLNNDEKAEVVRLYNRGKGKSVYALAKQFKVSRPTIDNVLVRANIKTRRN